MPIKTNKLTVLSKRWNFYVNEIDKLEYLKALVSNYFIIKFIRL